MMQEQIPKIIHQIWLGPKEPPSKWMDTWKKKNPDWEYKLWTEANLPQLKNQKQFDEANSYCGKADIARPELLHEWGGVYIDADCECLNSLDIDLRKYPFFACYEQELARPCLVANGVVGCLPQHPLTKQWMETIGDIENVNSKPHWVILGPYLFTLIVGIYDLCHGGITILPSYKFFPIHPSGIKYQGKDKVYATHHWLTTKNTDYDNSSFRYDPFC